jgi:hypothetical protein
MEKNNPLKLRLIHDKLVLVAFDVARWRSGLTHMPFTHAFRGSNPLRVTKNGRLAQLGEHLPYKQGVGGSIPSAPTMRFMKSAGLAQLVEHLTCNQGVEGSSPLAGTMINAFYKTSGSCGEVGVHAGLSHRRPRVRVPSAPPVKSFKYSWLGSSVGRAED